jgi:hypothetical protein
VDIDISGGTLSYTVAWNSGETTEDISGLAVGTYTVTVMDAAGCTAEATANVVDAGGPTVAFTQVDAGCGTMDGSIDLTVSGGALPYTIVWSNGATTEDIGALAAGTYGVTVTDENDCAVTSTINIAGGDAPAVSTDATGATGKLLKTSTTYWPELTVQQSPMLPVVNPSSP